MKSGIVCSVLMAYCLNVLPQDDVDPVYFSKGIQAHYGFIIPHAEEIKPVSGTKPAGLEVVLSRIDTSFSSWKIFSTFWFSGIQLGYFDFRNSDVLGGAFTATAFAEPVIAHSERFFFSVRAGAGFSYHTRIYNKETNPANQFFATRVNFPLYLNARFSYLVRRNTMLTLSGYYNHISNGGMKQPNFGMNFPTISAGISHFSRPFPDLAKDLRTDIRVRQGIALQLQAVTGYRVVDATGVYPEKGFLAYGFHIRAARQLRTWYALSAGAEIIMDGAIRETIKREGMESDYKRVALTAGQDLLFGRAAFSQHFGFYVYSPYKAVNIVYQKYELTYRFLPRIAFGTFLKAHAHVAELMGVSLSFYVN